MGSKNKLFFRDKPLFGLEISQTGLRAIALDSKQQVTSYGHLDLDPNNIEESLNRPGDFLPQNITQMLNRHMSGHLPSNQVALSVPTSKTFSRSLTLPLDAEAHLLDAVQLEAEEYIPVPNSELYIDYQLIARHKDRLEVLMCAVPRRTVDSLLDACARAKLEPVLIEPAIISLARLISRTEDGQLPTIIVDVGASSTDIAILDQTIRVTGSAPVGGQTFTLSIAKHLKIPLEQAHEIRVHEGIGFGSRQAKIKPAVTPLLDQIITEIRKIIRYYAERIGSTSKIEQVVIVGNGSNLVGMGDYITEGLLLPARIGSPWQSLTYDKVAELPRPFRPRYITAIGLGMIDPEVIWL